MAVFAVLKYILEDPMKIKVVNRIHPEWDFYFFFHIPKAEINCVVVMIV